MTALNWIMFENGIVLAADSMAHRVVEGRFEVHGFWTKVFPLPHLSGAMVATGLMQIGLDWFRVLQESIVARDLRFVDTIAPAQLRAIAGKYSAAYEATTTVYHFGVDPTRRTMLGFAYRSAKGFVSERLEMGLAFKPTDPETRTKAEALVMEHGPVDGLVEIMRLQKQHDDTQAADTRVGIGGEIHILTIEPSGTQCMWTAHRFPDFDARYTEAIRRLSPSP